MSINVTIYMVLVYAKDARHYVMTGKKDL